MLRARGCHDGSCPTDTPVPDTDTIAAVPSGSLVFLGGDPSSLKVDTLRAYGLVTPAQVAGLQKEADAAAAARLERSRVESMTLGVAVQDAREALVGLTQDLHSAKPLDQVLCTGDRLRGLGVLLLLLALTGLFVDYVAGS